MQIFGSLVWSEKGEVICCTSWLGDKVCKWISTDHLTSHTQ